MKTRRLNTCRWRVLRRDVNSRVRHHEHSLNTLTYLDQAYDYVTNHLDENRYQVLYLDPLDSSLCNFFPQIGHEPTLLK